MENTPHINVLTNVESILRFISQNTQNASDFKFTHHSGEYYFEITTGDRASLRIYGGRCDWDAVFFYDPYYDSVRDWGEVEEEALLHFLYSWHDAIKPRITKLSYVSSENFKV